MSSTRERLLTGTILLAIATGSAHVAPLYGALVVAQASQQVQPAPPQEREVQPPPSRHREAQPPPQQQREVQPPPSRHREVQPSPPQQ
jgi:hypothetical protein